MLNVNIRAIWQLAITFIIKTIHVITITFMIKIFHVTRSQSFMDTLYMDNNRNSYSQCEANTTAFINVSIATKKQGSAHHKVNEQMIQNLLIHNFLKRRVC